jgi:hypothetical protein
MKTLILFTTFLAASIVSAQSIGRLSYGGNGCPAGSITYSYAPSSHELVLNYNKFSTRSGGATRKSLDRKTCSLAIPVRVPAGYQMALVTESEGRAIVRQNGRATLNMETFYAGSTGIKKTKTYTAGQHYVSIGDSANRMAWSPCGQSTNLRMNLSAVTQRDASLQLEHLNFQLFFRACRR